MNASSIPGYWAATRARIASTLVSMARKANCIDGSADLEALRKQVASLSLDDPKREVVQGLILLEVICQKGEALARAVTSIRNELASLPATTGASHALSLVESELVAGHSAIAPIERHLSVQLAGYLTALHAVSAFRVGRGAVTRRAIGTITRERVEASAQAYRHLSREAAAAAIAEQIGKSPTTVRRLLTSIFPGDLWSKSIDSTGYIN